MNTLYEYCLTQLKSKKLSKVKKQQLIEQLIIYAETHERYEDLQMLKNLKDVL